jgi:hypothetical protein
MFESGYSTSTANTIDEDTRGALAPATTMTGSNSIASEMIVRRDCQLVRGSDKERSMTDHIPIRLTRETEAEIERCIDNAMREVKEACGNEPPEEVRKTQFALAKAHERKLLALNMKFENCKDFTALCNIGCDGAELLNHIYKLTGLEESPMPSWDDAVTIDRDDLKDFCGRAYAMANDLEYLFTAKGEEFISETARTVSKTLPEAMRSILVELQMLSLKLDKRRNRGVGGSNKFATLDFLLYVKMHCGLRFPSAAVSKVLTRALGEKITSDAVRKYVKANLDHF